MSVVTSITLTVSPHDAVMSALFRKVLDYLEMSYETTVGDQFSIYVPEGMEPNDTNGPVTITGWHAVMVFLGRWAHLIPSHPLHAAIVMEKLAFVREAETSDIEEALRKSQSAHSQWICPEFFDSTMADFLLSCKLKYMRSTMDWDESKVPLCERYIHIDVTMDPECEDGESEFDQPEEEKEDKDWLSESWKEPQASHCVIC